MYPNSTKAGAKQVHEGLTLEAEAQQDMVRNAVLARVAEMSGPLIQKKD